MLDLRTLYLIGLPIACLFALLQFLGWRRDRRQRALLIWAVADAVGIVGAGLFVARGHIPWWLSSSVGNALVFGTSFLIWAGMRQFAGQPVPARLFGLLTLASLVFMHGLWLWVDDLGLRVLAASMILALTNAGTAIDLLRAQAGVSSRGRSALTLLFALHALFYLFRAGTAMTLDAGTEFLETGGLQRATLILGIVKLVLWNLLVLMMARERSTGRAALSP